MSLHALLLIAVGVSADAFAVAVGRGLAVRRLDLRAALTLAVAFGSFQAAMPVLGWLLASQLADVVMTIDHWIAFGLLVALGIRMIKTALAPDPAESPPVRNAVLTLPQVLTLAMATSLDALAVGIGFALLDADILGAAALIGVVTLALSFMGVVVGHHAGAGCRRPAEGAGGLVLIAIGTQVLLSHLGLL